MDNLSEPPLEPHDPAAPRMWQLWRPFVGIHRWYFSPGCPPPLRNLHGWTAILQTVVLCAGMGLVAGVLAVAIIVGTSLFQKNVAFAQLSLMGLGYGIVVIYPLSRWIHRSVVWSLTGIAVCVLCYFAIIPMMGFWNEFLHTRSVRPTTASVRMLITVLVFAPSMMALGLFMRGSQRRVSWMLLGVFLSVVVFAASMELQNVTRSYLPIAFRRNMVISMIVGAQPVLLSWMFLSVALGMRLWPSMREPDDPSIEPARSSNPP